MTQRMALRKLSVERLILAVLVHVYFTCVVVRLVGQMIGFTHTVSLPYHVLRLCCQAKSQVEVLGMLIDNTHTSRSVTTCVPACWDKRYDSRDKNTSIKWVSYIQLSANLQILTKRSDLRCDVPARRRRPGTRTALCLQDENKLMTIQKLT
jgi:hypothetical protein